MRGKLLIEDECVCVSLQEVTPRERRRDESEPGRTLAQFALNSNIDFDVS